MKLIINIFLLCLLTNIVLAQPSITWQRSYVNPIPPYENTGEDICKADSNNFYILSSIDQPARAYIIKINQYGDTIWTRIIDSLGVTSGTTAYDNACIITGGKTTGAFALKINKLGYVEWYKTYNSGGYASCTSIIRTSLGNYLLCGRANYYDAYLLLIDSAGNLIWQRTYSSTDNKRFQTAIESYGNGYLIAGYESLSPTTYAEGTLTKVDNFGNIIWEKKYYINNYFISSYKSINKINSKYVVGGEIFSNSVGKRFTLVMNVDSIGEFINYKIYGDSIRNYDIGDIKIYGANYIVSSNLTSFTSYDILLKIFIIDTSGNILKEKLFDSTGLIYNRKCLPLTNGDILFAGTSNYYNPESENAFVTRTDSNLHTTPIGIKYVSTNYNLDFKLQAQPNPFNSNTVVTFNLPFFSAVEISLYDITGRVVKSIIEKYLPANKYYININMDEISSGIYFCVLKAGKHVETKKLVFIK